MPNRQGGGFVNWEAIGAIGEIVGAAAVFATLIYLALQIRQNTAMTNTSIYESAMGGFIDLNQIALFNPHVARAYMKGLADPDSLSEEESFYCNMLLRAYMNHVYKLFRLFQRGAFPAREWDLAATEASQILLGSEMGVRFARDNRYFDDVVNEIRRFESSDFTAFTSPENRGTANEA